MAASLLQQDSELLDSVCIADTGMCQCLAFTGQLSHILLADAAAVYTFQDALSSPAARAVVRKAKRIVFFVSWLNFECKNAMRAIVADAACEDVGVYSAVPLPDGDPLLHGLDCSCQHLPYSGRAFELQDVEMVLLPSTPTSVLAASSGSRRDEMAELTAAQLAGAARSDCALCLLPSHCCRAVRESALEAAIPGCERVLRCSRARDTRSNRTARCVFSKR
jgi:hypothetical protein